MVVSITVRIHRILVAQEIVIMIDLRRDGKVMKGDVEMWKDKMERSRERKRERG